MTRLTILVLAVLGCSADPADLFPAPTAVARRDCPVATLPEQMGSAWVITVCDRGSTFSPRFVSVETCAMQAGVYRANVIGGFMSTHPTPDACAPVTLVTGRDVARSWPTFLTPRP